MVSYELKNFLTCKLALFITRIYFVFESFDLNVILYYYFLSYVELKIKTSMKIIPYIIINGRSMSKLI